MRRTLAAGALLAAASAVPLRAQTLDDAVFMDRRIVCAGLFFTHDSWSQYWEGRLKRTSGNVGTVTTRDIAYMGAYGLTDRITLMASLPYVRTSASQGPLQQQQGVQDLTVSAKVRLLSTPFTSVGTMKVIAVGGYGTPVSDYSPDFLPLSIGLASKRVFGRATLSFQSKRGWYLNSSTGYTWRSNVRLDRPAYFTEGRLVLSNEVRMPNVADYVIAAGYQRPGFLITLPYTTQRTLGGGDIRRQDMPFVSNRMNFSKLEARAQYTLPKLKVASVWLGASRVLDGRNVGQSTGYMAGVVLAGRP
jgi:Putative MetA-pathway of phenol degradation